MSDNTPRPVSLDTILRDTSKPYAEQVNRRNSAPASPEAINNLQRAGNVHIKNILMAQGVENWPEVLSGLEKDITNIATGIANLSKNIDPKPFSDVLAEIGKIPEDKAKRFAGLMIARIQDSFAAYNRDQGR